MVGRHAPDADAAQVLRLYIVAERSLAPFFDP